MSFTCPIHGYYEPVPGTSFALCPKCSAPVNSTAAASSIPTTVHVTAVPLPPSAHTSAIDALQFALRTVTDPDLTEVEIRERIEGVARRTFDQIGLAHGA